jgi:hypothetical protein
MAKPKNPSALRDWLKAQAKHVTRIHFFLVGAFSVYILLSDAWDLITPTTIWWRWIVTAIMLVAMLLLWYAARRDRASSLYYKSIIYLVILTDIAFATFAIYTQRGMASRATILFTIPLLVSAVSLSRRALITTAALSAVAYFLAALKYYDSNPNEGYLAELYIEVGFYSVTLFILAAVLWSLIHPKKV